MLKMESLTTFIGWLIKSKHQIFRYGKVAKDSTFQLRKYYANSPLQVYLRMRLGGIFRVLLSIPPNVNRPYEKTITKFIPNDNDNNNNIFSLQLDAG